MPTVGSFFILPIKKTKNQKKCAKIARQISPLLGRVRGDFSFFVTSGERFFLFLHFCAIFRQQNFKTAKPLATFSTRKKE
jgi:hypothetical protein